MMSIARFVRPLKSPLDGVSDRAWTKFVRALDVQPIGATSASGGIGAYDMRPRRLVELGYAQRLPAKRTETGRLVQACEFVPPYTEKRFRTDATVQKDVLSRSIVLYHRELMSGKLQMPEGVSMSGALAVLHRAGKGALETWPLPEKFTDTRAVYERAKGIF